MSCAVYVVYRGDEVACVGSRDECARALGVKPKTVCFYASPAWKRRTAGRKRPTIAERVCEEGGLGKDAD